MVDFFVIAITCIIPLIIDPSPSTFDRCYLPKILSIYALCIFMLLVYFRKLRKKSINTYAPDYLIIGYLLLVTLSSFFSIDKGLSLVGRPLRWDGFPAMFCYVFIYFIVSKYYRFSSQHLKYFIFSGVLISVYGITQFYGYEIIKPEPRKIEWVYHSYSTIGNRNFLGSYLTLLLPISMYSFIHTKKISYLICSCILFACLLCSLTRGAWIGFAVSLIFFICYILKYKINTTHFIVMLTAFIVVTFTINTTSNGALLNRSSMLRNDMINTAAGKISSYNTVATRIFVWKSALKLIPDKPLLGSGPDTFGIVFMDRFGDELKRVFKTNDFYDKAHNEYLQQAVTTGVPSMIFYVAFGLTILLKAHKNIKNNKLLIPLFCSIVGYAVQAFANISVVSVAPILWVLLGIATNSAYEEKINIQQNSNGIASSSISSI